MPDHIHFTCAPDTPADKWLLLAKYAAQQSGIPAEDLPAALEKATGLLRVRKRLPVRAALRQPEAQQPLPHPALEVQWQALAKWAAAWPEMLAGLITTLPDDDVLDEAASLAKAVRLSWLFPLSDGQWASVRGILDWALQMALRWLTPRPLPRLTPPPAARNIVLSLDALPVAIRDSYVAAVKMGIDKADDEPLTPVEQYAIGYARRSAGAKLRPLLTRLNGQIEGQLLEAERQAVQTATVTALESRQGPSALASVLGNIQKNWERDWLRVGRTELGTAYNQGAVARIIADHTPAARRGQEAQEGVPEVRVYKIPSVNACLSCVAIWTLPDGSPKLYPLSEVLANGTNEGRPQAEWRATVALTHPNCSCGVLSPYTPALEPTFAHMREAHAQRALLA